MPKSDWRAGYLWPSNARQGHMSQQSHMLPLDVHKPLLAQGSFADGSVERNMDACSPRRRVPSGWGRSPLDPKARRALDSPGAVSSYPPIKQQHQASSAPSRRSSASASSGFKRTRMEDRARRGEGDPPGDVRRHHRRSHRRASQRARQHQGRKSSRGLPGTAQAQSPGPAATIFRSGTPVRGAAGQ